MTVTATTTLTCDRCETSLPNSGTDPAAASWARLDASVAGGPRQADICPTCLAALTQFWATPPAPT